MLGERKVTEVFAVCGQVDEEGIAAAADRGIRLIVNNRPDGEEPAQPSAAQLGEAARRAGLAYLHLPVRGMPTRDQVEKMHAAIAVSDGPVLAFCRSGMRSVFTWALGQQLSGDRSRDELVELARSAGYDLGGHLPR